MRVMNVVFIPFIDSFVIVYLDDKIVYSYTWEDHLMHIKKVLKTLHDKNILLKRSKYEFVK